MCPGGNDGLVVENEAEQCEFVGSVVFAASDQVLAICLLNVIDLLQIEFVVVSGVYLVVWPLCVQEREFHVPCITTNGVLVSL